MKKINLIFVIVLSIFVNFLIIYVYRTSKLVVFIPGEPDLQVWNTYHLKSSDICIVSHYDTRADFVEKTVKNHEDYTSRHGYSYKFRIGNISGNLFKDSSKQNKTFREGLYWQKVIAVREELDRSNCRWVMWIDADVMFTNFTKKVEDILKQYAFRMYHNIQFENHLILSAEQVNFSSVINAGVFLVRNSGWSVDFFKEMANAYPYYKNKPLPEQEFLQDAAYQRIQFNQFSSYRHPKTNAPIFANLLEKVIVIPQREMNSFRRFDVYDGIARWHEGDYIAHLSGSSNDARLDMIRSLVPKIVW